VRGGKKYHACLGEGGRRGKARQTGRRKVKGDVLKGVFKAMLEEEQSRVLKKRTGRRFRGKE